MTGSPAAPSYVFRSRESTDGILGGGISSLIVVKLSVLILAGIVGLVCNGGLCLLSSFSLSNLIFVLNMKGSFSSLLYKWNHPL